MNDDHDIQLDLLDSAIKLASDEISDSMIGYIQEDCKDTPPNRDVIYTKVVDILMDTVWIETIAYLRDTDPEHSEDSN
jgi:hypothetical protein